MSLASPPPLRVWMFGPALDVKGGVPSVERVIVERLASPALAFKMVGTMHDGRNWRKVVTFLGAVGRWLRPGARRPDLVHVHFSARGSAFRKALLCVLFRLAGKPLVLHAHGSEFRAFFASLPTPLRAALAGAFRGCDRFIALSDSWAAYYVEAFRLDPQQVVVLRNPVELPPSLPTRTGRQELTIVCLGRLGERKGTFTLIRAFAALSAARRATARLVLAGDGESGRARALAAELGVGDRVVVQSWITPTERDALLAAADVFALPSCNEGLPMAMLEAMGWGLPVVVTPVGGIPEVVRHGETGWLVPVGEVAPLTEALEALLGEEAPRLALGAAGRQAVEELGLESYERSLRAIYTAALGSLSRGERGAKTAVQAVVPGEGNEPFSHALAGTEAGLPPHPA